MRNAPLVLAALAMVGCASGTVRGHATSSKELSGPAMGVVAAPHGVATAARPGSAAPLSRGTLAAVNAYRETTEPAVLRPCKIQITSEMQRQLNGTNGTNGMNGRPLLKIKEISVPCTTRCPGERGQNPTRAIGPRPGN
jgi:hypothetical protein